METVNSKHIADPVEHAQIVFARFKAAYFRLVRSKERLELARQYSENPTSKRMAESLTAERERSLEDWKRLWVEAAAALTPEQVVEVTDPNQPDPYAAQHLLEELKVFDWNYARSDDHAYWRSQNSRWVLIESLARKIPDGAAIVESHRPRAK